MSAAGYWAHINHYKSEGNVLYKLISVVATFVPSEALCERVFALLKKQVNPQRTRLAVDSVFSQLQLNLLLRDEQNLRPFAEPVVPDAARGGADAGVVEVEDDEQHVVVDEEDVIPMPDNVTVTDERLTRFMEWSIVDYQQRAGRADDACLVCQEFAGIAPPVSLAMRAVHHAQMVQCRSCWKSCGAGCYVHYRQETAPVEDGQWRCPACVYGARVARPPRT